MDKEILAVLEEEGVSPALLDGARAFREQHPAPEEAAYRIPEPEYIYYGKQVWEEALAALLAGENLLLEGSKATGKNVLAENLAALLGRPEWDVSFHINVDASYLIGSDTYDGEKVVFRPGPVYLTAKYGGFGVLDEINMAKNEALAVLHSALDFRRIIDVPGYEKVDIDPAARFIGTMNYGYAGTRELNEALCSRFAIINMPVITEDGLKKLITRAFPEIRPDICSQFMQLFYELRRKAESAEISERALDLRGILDAIRLIRCGLSSGDALELCITNKTFDRYERDLIRDVIRARIPQDLTGEDVFGA
ncbi:MAG: AAA family ATPase [Anaerovoracaceae bacterium]|jgi:nitric oxide reductase NorQ protein